MPRRADAIDVRGGIVPEDGQALFEFISNANPRARWKLLVHLASVGAIVTKGNLAATSAQHVEQTPAELKAKPRRKVVVSGNEDGCPL